MAAALAAAALQADGDDSEESALNIGRFMRHLWMTRWYASSVFPARTLDAVEQAIRHAEFSHGGEIRFAVEAELHILDLLRGLTPRERALQVFGELGVWDTDGNNGVLIYVLLADHDVEIVADRGYARRVEHGEWQDVCHTMEQAFRAGEYERGAIAGVNAVSRLMAQHFPAIDRNELPDRPAML